MFFFFFQAEDGIRDTSVTGVQTCALPIYRAGRIRAGRIRAGRARAGRAARWAHVSSGTGGPASAGTGAAAALAVPYRLGHRAISLGAANAIDYAIQFLLPVVLVRYLTPEAFGSYRLLWLVAGTVMAVVTQAMAGGLYYFLPRSGDEEKRLYINQALLYLSAAGLIAACAVSGWNPDRKSTRLNSSHRCISYAVFCLKK